MTAPLAQTLAISVQGPSGALDLVVPAGATSVDVAREYARQTAMPVIPLLQTPVGELVDAGRSLSAAGVVSGDVLIAAVGLHRPRPSGNSSPAAGHPDAPAPAGVIGSIAAGFALLAGWYAAAAGEDAVRLGTVGVLVVAAVFAALPLGPQRRTRAAVAPVFAVAATLGALHQSGSDDVAAVMAAMGLAAAVVAAVVRALSSEVDEPAMVWLVAGLTTAFACALSPLLEWDQRVSWTLLVLVATLTARFAPSLAIDVPDEALLDLDRLAVTAWSARDADRRAKRSRLIVASQAMSALVASASRTVTAAAVSVFVGLPVASALLLRDADLELDRIGACCLVFFAGGSVLFAARAYRHAAARRLLRGAGLLAWLVLGVALAQGADSMRWQLLSATAIALGAILVAVAVASGRGWRSVWWARRAELGEALCGSFAVASAVVAAGVFRGLWEMTS